jgi:Tfp pilus assembly protein PilX
MDSPFKIFDYRRKSEDGFVLIAAIMAVMIMLAVGFFILTTSTQDIRISSRLVGERKALSAAEAGAEARYASTLTLNDLVATPDVDVQIDPTNDPSVSYSALTRIINGSAVAIGYDLASGFSGSVVYETVVTGKDSSHDSSASIAIGMVPPPTQVTTVYGNAGAGGG